ncbi:MAG: hypothetical protein IJU70_07645, partial [Lentisphaeria bacterium]|nr:hypothetical protein [Lentisphaeria bacterium]
FMLIWGQTLPAKAFRAVPPGTLMELRARVRTEDAPVRAKIYFESVKARRTVVRRKLIFPGRWDEIFLQFEKEAIDYPGASVFLQLEGKGKVFYDDVYFGPAAAKKVVNLIGNAGGEGLDAKGIPFGWSQVKYNPVGELFVGKGSPSGGNVSFGFSSPKNPVKPLGWRIMLKREAFTGIAPGSPMTISFDLTTFADPSVKVRCYAEFMDGGKYVGTFGENHSVYAGWERKEFTFALPPRRFTHCWVCFMLKTEGRACFDNVELRQGTGTKKKSIGTDYCRVKDLPPRRTWFAPEKPEKLDIEFKLAKPELSVTLAEIDGAEIKTWRLSDLPTGKIATHTLDLPALSAGAYELIFKSGEVDDCEWFALRTKKPAVHFTPDHYMTFKGKPFFPIAMAHPNRLGNAGVDGLRVYAESGINMISEYEIFAPWHAEYLNAMCNQFGFLLWLKEDFGARPRQKGAALREHLKQLRFLTGKIDNFAGLQSDEAAWHPFPLESVRRHSKYRFKYMPDYYTWQCNAPRMTDKTGNPRSTFDVVRRYALAADVTGADIYPVPEGRSTHNDLPDQTLACVGDYTDLVRKMVWDARPVWMVLQAMSWREERLEAPNAEWPRPTKEQLRFMVWNAVTHGATGICWYGHGAWTDQYSEWYRQFAEVNLELAAAAKIMLAGKTEKIPPAPKGVGVLARTGIRVFVNESGKKDAQIDVPAGWYVCPTGKALPQGPRTLAPYEVLILTAKPLALAPVKRFVPRKTELAAIPGVRAETVLIDGLWCAHPDYLRGEERKFFAKHTLNLDESPRKAVLLFSADDAAELSVNGKKISGTFPSHRCVSRINIAGLLKKGGNILVFKVHNKQGSTGLVYSLDVDGKKFSSGPDTQFSLDGKEWKKARTFGKPPTAPWGKPLFLVDIR